MVTEVGNLGKKISPNGEREVVGKKNFKKTKKGYEKDLTKVVGLW